MTVASLGSGLAGGRSSSGGFVLQKLDDGGSEAEVVSCIFGSGKDSVLGLGRISWFVVLHEAVGVLGEDGLDFALDRKPELVRLPQDV